MKYSEVIVEEEDLEEMYYAAVPIAFSGPVFGFQTALERDNFLVEARIKTPGAFPISAEVFAAVQESASETKH